MSLNKFTDTEIKPYMKIGCLDIKTDSFETSSIKYPDPASQVGFVLTDIAGGGERITLQPSGSQPQPQPHNLNPVSIQNITSISSSSCKYTRTSDNIRMDIDVELVPNNKTITLQVDLPQFVDPYTANDLTGILIGSFGGYETLYFQSNISENPSTKLSVTFMSIGSSNLNLGTTPIKISGYVKYTIS